MIDKLIGFFTRHLDPFLMAVIWLRMAADSCSPLRVSRATSSMAP